MRIGASNDQMSSIQIWQKRVMVLFHISLILKVIAAFVPALNFPSGIVLALFLLLELFLLPPAGMALMCVFVSAFYFALPFAVITMAEILIESMVLLVVGAVLAYAFTGFLITVVNGFITSIQYVSGAAFMVPATASLAATAATGAVMQAGTKAAINAAGNTVRKKGSGFRSFLGCVIILAVIGWPCLSYANAISGGFACKPAVLLSQAHLNHMNIGANRKLRSQFNEKAQWVFENGFYDDYVYNGSNNIAQGEKNLIAGNEETLAYIANGVLYVQNPTITDNYCNAGYRAKETDALVVKGTDAYVFGCDKVFVCGKRGYYTWKKTNWTSDFEKLSVEEQFERVYDILQRQNTTQETKFSYDEVGVVAYAQRNGLLIEYDSETNCAYFAEKAKDGEITVFLQSAPNQREELVSFTPTYNGTGLPYTMAGDDGILYLRDDQIVFIDKYSQDEVVTFTHPEENRKTDRFVSLHYVDLGERGRYSIYLDEKDQIWIDTRLIGVGELVRVDWKCDEVRVTGFAGPYIYSLEHENDLLSKLTYFNDMDAETEYEGWKFHDIWAESNDYQRIELKPSAFDEELAEAEKQAEEERLEAERQAEEERLNDPLVRFPEPELKSRRGREVLYDETYIATATYSTYTGPQNQFFFKYPPALYDQVDYNLENEGNDIDILFTCSEDQSSLEVSVHPMPAGVADLTAFAEELCAQERDLLSYGKQNDFVEYSEQGCVRFYVQGTSPEQSDMQCHVICQVDGENIMKMIIRIPKGRDDAEQAVKSFYVKKLHYHCGFGILDKAPVI